MEQEPSHAARAPALGVRPRTARRARRSDDLRPPDLPPPPYPGLAPYATAEADLFFGRARASRTIVANLRAARLTVLFGPSGVGKSSLLRAAVVPRLPQQRDPGQPIDVVVVDDWSGDAVRRIAAQVRALADDEPDEVGERDGQGDADDPDQHDDDASADPLVAAVAEHCARGRRLLLVLDQFEEHLHADERGIAPALDELVADVHLGVRILIAIREDRLAELDRFAGEVPQLLGNVLRLDPLTPDEALEAIAGPVERWASLHASDVSLELGLAEQVRDELVALATTDPAGTPGERSVDPTVLQIVMRQLWDEDVVVAGSSTVRRATLERLGGARRIVATQVEAALDALDEHERALAAEMLGFLVTPSGATTILTALDLAVYTDHPEDEVGELAERLSRPPRPLLRGVAAEAVRSGGYELPHVLAGPVTEWRARRRTARLERRNRLLAMALAAMTAIVFALVAYAVAPSPLPRLEHATVDARFDVRGARGADPRIAIVSIDTSTVERLRNGPKRLYRTTVARALGALEAARPRAVAVDIDYSKRVSQAGDEALIAAIHGRLSSRLVLATTLISPDGTLPLFGRDDELYSDHHRPALGYAGYPRDPGDVARRMRRSISIESGSPAMESIDVAAARLAGNVDPSKLPSVGWIDYRGPAGTFPRVAFADVLGRKPAALAKLRDRIVVLGTEQIALPTSAPGPPLMRGPEIRANAISTAIDDFSLRNTGAGVDIALIVALGLLPLALGLLLRVAFVLPAALLAGALFCGAAELAFAEGHMVAVVAPLLSLALSMAGTLGVLLVLRRKARAGASAAGSSDRALTPTTSARSRHRPRAAGRAPRRGTSPVGSSTSRG